MSCKSNEVRKEISTSQPFSADLKKKQGTFYAAKYPLEMLPVEKKQKATEKLRNMKKYKRISGKR